MNFLQLAQQLRQETGTQGTGPASVTEQAGEYKRLVDWVNLAYIEICNKWLDWKFLWAETTVQLVGTTRDYAWPAGAAIVNEDSFFIGDRKLSPIPFEVYRVNRPEFDGQTGEPDAFTIQPNGMLRFFPTPAVNAVVHLEMQRFGQRMAANTDMPLIPANYLDAVMWRGKMFWAEHEEAAEQYQSALTNFNQAMQRLEAAQLPSREFAHGRVQGAEITVRAE